MKGKLEVKVKKIGRHLTVTRKCWTKKRWLRKARVGFPRTLFIRRERIAFRIMSQRIFGACLYFLRSLVLPSIYPRPFLHYLYGYISTYSAHFAIQLRYALFPHLVSSFSLSYTRSLSLGIKQTACKTGKLSKELRGLSKWNLDPSHQHLDPTRPVRIIFREQKTFNVFPGSFHRFLFFSFRTHTNYNSSAHLSYQ